MATCMASPSHTICVLMARTEAQKQVCWILGRVDALVHLSQAKLSCSMMITRSERQIRHHVKPRQTSDTSPNRKGRAGVQAHPSVVDMHASSVKFVSEQRCQWLNRDWQHVRRWRSRSHLVGPKHLRAVRKCSTPPPLNSSNTDYDATLRKAGVHVNMCIILSFYECKYTNSLKQSVRIRQVQDTCNSKPDCTAFRIH